MERWSNEEVESAGAGVSTNKLSICMSTCPAKMFLYARQWKVSVLLLMLYERESIVLVVSRLITLMKDQLAKLKAKRVEAVEVGERCDINKVHEERYPILFISTADGQQTSLCAPFDALWKRESIVLVVSPLIALIKDQVTKLKAKRVEAVDVGERCDINKEYKERYIILFISTGNWQQMANVLSQVYQRHLMAVVVGEAHCVKKW